MGLSVHLRDDAEAIRGLSVLWDELWRHSSAKVPFLRPTWMDVWWRHYGVGRQLRLLGVWDDGGRLVGLAPLCTGGSESLQMEWIGGEDVADSLDFLLWEGMEGSVLEVMDRALRQLAGRHGGLILRFIQEDSFTLADVNPMLRDGWDVEIEWEESSPFMDLPSTWEAFLDFLPGKARHELRRKLGKIDRELSPRFRVLETEEEWEDAMAHFFRLHRLSRVQKAQFMTEERERFFREVARVFFQDGGLRLTWLETNGKAIASALSFVYDGTWGLYNSGYDPQYRDLSPGIVLVAHTIRQAMEEGLKRYDFLRGRERYKYDLGGRDKDLYCLRLTARSVGEA